MRTVENIIQKSKARNRFPGKKKVCLVYLAAVILMSAGCGHGTDKKEAVKEEETVIPVSFLVNPDTGENENENLVEAFNEAYDGKYRVEVEWITDTAEGYRDVIKKLNSVDRLPAIITDAGFDDDFYQLLIGHDRLVNLEQYIAADENWRNILDERVMSMCREKDGSIYLSPSGNMNYSYAGFYYNKESFEEAGIKEFPTDWEEFFQCLDKLKDKGFTPLAIHGGSSYWTSLLIGTNYMAGTREGSSFMKHQYPQDYNKDCVKDMFEFIRKLYQYGDEDALEIERTDSALRFVDGQGAVTANGGWMLHTFSKEVKERTGFAPFPGNILMEDPKMSAWAATTGYSENVTEGAVEFLKFRTLQNQKSVERFFQSEESTTVEEEYKKAVFNVDSITSNYQLKWQSEIQEEVLANTLPAYILGDITVEELVETLNAAVKQINLIK